MDLNIQQSKSQPLLDACNGVISNLDKLVNFIGDLDKNQREFHINKLTESGRLLEDLALHQRLDISERMINNISNQTAFLVEIRKNLKLDNCDDAIETATDLLVSFMQFRRELIADVESRSSKDNVHTNAALIDQADLFNNVFITESAFADQLNQVFVTDSPIISGLSNTVELRSWFNSEVDKSDRTSLNNGTNKNPNELVKPNLTDDDLRYLPDDPAYERAIRKLKVRDSLPDLSRKPIDQAWDDLLSDVSGSPEKTGKVNESDETSFKLTDDSEFRLEFLTDDSDIKLSFSDHEPVLSAESGIELEADDSGITLVDEQLRISPEEQDSGLYLLENESGIQLGATAGIDSEISLDAEDSAITLEAEDSDFYLSAQDSGIQLGVEDSGISLDCEDSAITLEAEDSDFYLSAHDSGIQLGAGDSGISLECDESGISLDIEDSGICLSIEDSGIQLGGGDSGISLDCDDSGISLDVEEFRLDQNRVDSGINLEVRPLNKSADDQSLKSADPSDEKASLTADSNDYADVKSEEDFELKYPRNDNSKIIESRGFFSRAFSALTLGIFN